MYMLHCILTLYFNNRARAVAHNKLMDLQGNIRVIARVRPVLEVEQRSGQGTEVTDNCNYL
jgi:hypothetical protein